MDGDFDCDDLSLNHNIFFCSGILNNIERAGQNSNAPITQFNANKRYGRG